MLRTLLSRLRAIYTSTKIIDLSSPGRFYESLRMMWLYQKVNSYTMLSIHRLNTLYKLARDIDLTSIPGDIVECGVWNGGSAGVMAYIVKQSPLIRDIWLFDSFEGLPEPIEKDGAKAQGYAGKNIGDPLKVKELMQKLGVSMERVHIVKGWFRDTFPLTRIEQISLLHIDADWYESVKLCLEHFYDRVQPGGFVVLDDYGSWEGCRAAVDEFVAKRGLEVKLVQVDHAGRYFQKAI